MAWNKKADMDSDSQIRAGRLFADPPDLQSNCIYLGEVNRGNRGVLRVKISVVSRE